MNQSNLRASWWKHQYHQYQYPLLQPFWLQILVRMACSSSESSDDSSDTSAASGRSSCSLKPWRRRWWSGSYIFFWSSSSISPPLLCFFPRELTEDQWKKPLRTTFSVLRTSPRAQFMAKSPSSGQLASFGAGCAAAFLINRSQSSAHASSAFGYAGINWVQSILAPAGVVQHGRYYGTMAHIYESYSTFNQYRLPLCLVALLWLVCGRPLLLLRWGSWGRGRPQGHRH